MAKVQVALQLYTVREDTGKDFIGTLKRVAEIGYPAVELAGAGGLSAAELGKVLRDLGLEVWGTHVGFNQMLESLQELIDFNKAIGNSYLICPGLPGERTTDAAAYAETARLYNEIGAKALQQGMHVGHHNHNREFETPGGKAGMDILIEGTDPANFGAELDVFWAKYANIDPAAYIRKFPGRFPLLHIKDMHAGEDRKFAEIGEGILNWPAIFDAAETVGGTKCYIVEQDNCYDRAPLDSVKLSLENLKKMGKL